MLIVQRQRQLLTLLQQRQAASLDELAAALGVSASTVRRDLDALEVKGLAKRTHGGAVYRGEPDAATVQPAPTIALATRMTQNVAAKIAIGRAAAALVEPGMTVLLDGGSTVIVAARFITARPIQVVTTSLTLAQHFKDDDDVELILAGGSLYPRTEVFTGSLTSAALEKLNADLLLTSMAGVYEDEVYNINLAMARIERVMMQQATSRVLLMDASKFGRRSLARVAGVEEFEAILTDDAVPQADQDRLGDRLQICANGPQ